MDTTSKQKCSDHIDKNSTEDYVAPRKITKAMNCEI